MQTDIFPGAKDPAPVPVSVSGARCDDLKSPHSSGAEPIRHLAKISSSLSGKPCGIPGKVGCSKVAERPALLADTEPPLKTVAIDCMWFINDDQGYRQSLVGKVFSGLIRITNLNIKQFRSRYQRENLLVQLTAIAPILVWVRMPGQATMTGTKHDAQNS